MNKELSIIELDSISGGTSGQTRSDSKLLHKLGIIDEDFNDFELLFKWESSSAKVDSGWAKLGITCVTCYDFDNQYFYKGKPISWNKAQEMARMSAVKGPQIKH
ncbi:MAG: hypothetical protein J5777_08380 [Clostridiales bacterium]|nr:hypothetical protein [Clostridiales bacterium]